MKKNVTILGMLLWVAMPLMAQDWKLVWSDEFNKDGRPDSTMWNYEQGFVRNHEDQWYQPQNAYQQNGLLIIEGRREQRPNPTYREHARYWGQQRKTIDYTSACITTQGKYSFLYGRLEVRARIPVAGGSWPAIWTLGSGMEWPSCGEIDIMEFYRINGNEVPLASTVNGSIGRHQNPFNSPQYLLLNLALGGDNGGTIDDAAFPMRYEIDYVRVYQKLE